MKKEHVVFNILLNILIFLSIVFTPFFKIDGGISDDTFNYVTNAHHLPSLISSVFPLGYPLAIKAANLISGDYYFATRIIACSGYLFMIVFSYIKKFFFRETTLLMGLKVFTIFTFSYSETLFLPLFYVLIFLLHKFFTSGFPNRINIISISLVMLFLITVRYSSIFILGAFMLMLGLELLKKNRDLRIIKSLVAIIILASVGTVIFLSFNYYITGGFVGENHRNGSAFSATDSFGFILKNIIFSFLNAMNPILNVLRISFLTFIISVGISLAAVIAVSFLLCKLVVKKKLDRFRIMLFCIAMSVFAGLIYSSLTTGIDGLHIRLALPVFFCIYFILLISYHRNNFVFGIVLLSVFANSFITYYESFNYLDKRENVKKYLAKTKKSNYYLNDIGKIPTETGGTKTSNFFTVFSLNPEIKVITKNQNKIFAADSVILESELVKIEPVNRTEMINNKTFSK